MIDASETIILKKYINYRMSMSYVCPMFCLCKTYMLLFWFLELFQE